MTASDYTLAQFILMALLVVVTGIYACRTHVISKATKEQANASVKMAEEMREQRYNALRPVIDVQIVDVHRQVESQMTEAPIVTDDVCYELSCILHNIGLGPAIGVCSVSPTSRHWRWDFDTLATGESRKITNLPVKQEGGLLTVSVFYTDVYGRGFNSGRQVNINKEKRDWTIGPLLVSDRENKS